MGLYIETYQKLPPIESVNPFAKTSNFDEEIEVIEAAYKSNYALETEDTPPNIWLIAESVCGFSVGKALENAYRNMGIRNTSNQIKKENKACLRKRPDVVEIPTSIGEAVTRQHAIAEYLKIGYSYDSICHLFRESGEIIFDRKDVPYIGVAPYHHVSEACDTYFYGKLGLYVGDTD